MSRDLEALLEDWGEGRKIRSIPLTKGGQTLTGLCGLTGPNKDPNGSHLSLATLPADAEPYLLSSQDGRLPPQGGGCREWQHPLPKMTEKLPDTWAWPHLELGAPGLEHCGHTWLGIHQFSSCTLGHFCASFASPLSPHTLDLINAATINLKLGKGLKWHKAPHFSFRICDCLLSAWIVMAGTFLEASHPIDSLIIWLECSLLQMTPPLWQKVKRNLKASWWKWKRRVKSWLKAQHSEN